MIQYLMRRLAYGVLILLGVNFLTFVLFFAVNTPDDMAHLAIGSQRVSVEAIEQWLSASMTPVEESHPVPRADCEAWQLEQSAVIPVQGANRTLPHLVRQ